MIDLVTLQQGKDHLRIEDDDHDADIASKISQASWTVMKFLKLKEVPPTWWIGSPPTAYSIPQDIQGVVLDTLSELYWNREISVTNVISDDFVRRLEGYRDPALG